MTSSQRCHQKRACVLATGTESLVSIYKLETNLKGIKKERVAWFIPSDVMFQPKWVTQLISPAYSQEL